MRIILNKWEVYNKSVAALHSTNTCLAPKALRQTVGSTRRSVFVVAGKRAPRGAKGRPRRRQIALISPLVKFDHQGGEIKAARRVWSRRQRFAGEEWAVWPGARPAAPLYPYGQASSRAAMLFPAGRRKLLPSRAESLVSFRWQRDNACSAVSRLSVDGFAILFGLMQLSVRSFHFVLVFSCMVDWNLRSM